MKRRMTVFVLLLAIVLGTVLAVVPASASVSGRQATAAALTGLAAYELARGNTGTGILAGVGAVVAWDRANQAKREERERYYGYYPYYDQGYYDQGYYDQGYYDQGYYDNGYGYHGRGYYGGRDDRRFRNRDDRSFRHRGDWGDRPSWQQDRGRWDRGDGDWDD